MRAWWHSAIGVAVSASAMGQVPDVAPFLELRPSWQVRSTKKSLFHWYDPLGRHSLVGLRMVLEPGYRVYVAQRFERINNSGDPDSMDEYFIEDRGHWRVGKQYLPFGRREVMRTTAAAVRADTDLFFDEAPIVVAACDAGSGRTRGVFARLGGPIGASVAIGNHLAIQSTDLTTFRDVDAAPGLGRGYRLAYGLDTLASIGSGQLTAEWASLRRGETPADRDKDLTVVRLRFLVPGTRYRADVRWSRDWSARRDTTIIEGELVNDTRVTYVPFLRLEGLGFRDFGLTAVIRF